MLETHHKDEGEKPPLAMPWWLIAIMPTAAITSVGLLVILSFRAALAIHSVVHPGIDLAHLSAPSGVLMFFGCFLGSVTPGLVLANLLLWLVPQIRAGVEKYDPERPFKESMLTLLKVMPFLVVPGISMALIGAFEPWAH